MESMVVREALVQSVPAGFAVIATAFVQESLSHMVPWLITTAAVIVCDLAFGVRRSMLMGEEIRISRAIRRTMGKMVTYFAFVCMVCMVNVAAGGKYDIDKWACLLICGLEFLSIVSNILKPKGYSLNARALAAAVLTRLFGTGRDELDHVIEKDKEKKR